jgi:hypothetical protein
MRSKDVFTCARKIQRVLGVHFVTVSVSRLVEMTWKEVFHGPVEVLYGIFQGKTEESHEKPHSLEQMSQQRFAPRTSCKIARNPTVHSRVHKIPPLIPVLRQMNQVSLILFCKKKKKG